MRVKGSSAVLVGWLFATLAGVCATSASAADSNACVHRPAPVGAAGRRIALVIGDGAYAGGIPALTNPGHDAAAVAKAVGALGFEVFLSVDADSATLQRCLDDVYSGLVDADVALLYYSGHGIQIKDENYILATDATSRYGARLHRGAADRR